MDGIEIVGLGYCGLDYLCLAPRIPIDDKVEALETLTQGGGPSATAIYAAGKLGAKTAFIGVRGDDSRGLAIDAGLKEVSVNTSSMIIRKNVESPAAFCWTEAETGKRSIVWTRGALKPVDPEELNLDLIASSKVLHLDGHQTKAALKAAEYAASKDVAVSIDAGTIVPEIEKLLDFCNIIIASEKFAERFTGKSNPEKSVKMLYRKNCRFSAVTLGSDGSLGFDGKELFRQAPYDVKVVDTTGAGDVFHGAFVYKYAKGGNWRECMRFATGVSALKCTKFGGRTGIPTLNELEKFLADKD